MSVGHHSGGLTTVGRFRLVLVEPQKLPYKVRCDLTGSLRNASISKKEYVSGDYTTNFHKDVNADKVDTFDAELIITLKFPLVAFTTISSGITLPIRSPTQGSNDVKIKVGEEMFSGNKEVLQSFSGFFSLVLNGDWKENSDGVIDLKEINPDAFKVIKEFMDTGKLEFVDNTTLIEIINASDFLQIDCLTKLACNRLSLEIPNGKECEYLLLGHRVGAQVLVSRVVGVIAKNHQNFLSKPEFADVKKYQEILFEILQRIPTFVNGF